MFDVWAPDGGEDAGKVFLNGEELSPKEASELAKRLADAAEFAGGLLVRRYFPSDKED